MANNYWLSLKKTCCLMVLLLWASLAFGQIKVTGSVVDDTNLPMMGVSIVQKGASGVGTISDLDGNFSIEVKDESAVLVFSYIGFATQEVKVGKQKTLQIVLKEDGAVLEEVVAIGYATVKKSDLTGSVDKVDMNELNKAPVASFDQALGGRIAGVQALKPTS